VGSDTRRRDAGDSQASLRSGNAVDGPTPPQPEGRKGVAGVSGVARRRRCLRIASSSRLGSTPQDPCAEDKGLVTQTTRHAGCSNPLPGRGGAGPLHGLESSEPLGRRSHFRTELGGRQAAGRPEPCLGQPTSNSTPCASGISVPQLMVQVWRRM
jgi:hypothetical protein